MSFMTSSSSSLEGRAAVKSDSESENSSPGRPFPFPSFMTMPPTQTSLNSSSSSSSSDDNDHTATQVSFVSSTWDPLQDADLEQAKPVNVDSKSKKQSVQSEQAPPTSQDGCILPIVLAVFFCCTIPVMIPILIIWYSRATRAD